MFVQFSQRLKSSEISMRPKTALVLSENINYTTLHDFSVLMSSSPQSLVFPSAMTLFALGYILAIRYGVLSF